jgi:F-type H+-transporting ATPase subunit epsilon
VATRSFNCRVITPEAKILDEVVVQAILPAWDGQMGFLVDRAAVVTKLGIGELRLDFPDSGGSEGGSRSYFVEDGFAHMIGNNLTILAGAAIPEERLSESEAQAELAEALARRTDDLPPQEAEKVRRQRERAQAKVSMARAFRARGSSI